MSCNMQHDYLLQVIFYFYAYMLNIKKYMFFSCIHVSYIYIYIYIYILERDIYHISHYIYIYIYIYIRESPA